MVYVIFNSKDSTSITSQKHFNNINSVALADNKHDEEDEPFEYKVENEQKNKEQSKEPNLNEEKEE